MDCETVITSVELWNYLPIQTLIRLLQCNRKFYQVLVDTKTWEILIYRDFGRSSKDPNPHLEYKTLEHIVTQFSKGKTLTTDALNMLLYFFPITFHKDLRTTHTFYNNIVIYSDVLSEATLERAQEYCGDYDEELDQDHFSRNKLREFVDNLRKVKYQKIDKLRDKVKHDYKPNKKYMLYGTIPYNMVPMYVNGKMVLSFDLELILCESKM